MPFATTGMGHDGIKLSDISLTKTRTIGSLMRNLKKKKKELIGQIGCCQKVGV